MTERVQLGVRENLAQFSFARASYRSPALRSCSQAGLVNNLNDGLAWGLVPLFLAAHGAGVGEIGLVAAVYPGAAELRDLAHGILPASLNRGLRAGVETLVSRVRLPVSIDVTDERLPPALEATAYFIVAEALTNVVKHAGARSAHITAHVDDGPLRVEVRDDGVGGARHDSGSGLLGLHDRAAAMNGELTVESPPGQGTTIVATLPVPEP